MFFIWCHVVSKSSISCGKSMHFRNNVFYVRAPPFYLKMNHLVLSNFKNCDCEEIEEDIKCSNKGRCVRFQFSGSFVACAVRLVWSTCTTLCVLKCRFFAFTNNGLWIYKHGVTTTFPSSIYCFMSSQKSTWMKSSKVCKQCVFNADLYF